MARVVKSAVRVRVRQQECVSLLRGAIDRQLRPHARSAA